ncbi:precorrin-6y C5,15-methyltransferase (decarboxylating) subunit CbiE [Mesorhizobium sp. CN2-181]|uniref:precorrin-6y C5,15-methyltransferase (decarboxylating) subunit CbiE n=1 Tax=Mesorhizobium yinganensis TaxID=3157707 RepID=UPI0032B7705D
MRWVMMAAKQTMAAGRWLSVIGIGEDGLDGLGAEARRRISEAEIVFGGKRHLALAAAEIKGESKIWPSPFDSQLREVLALRGRKICVLASGDPFLHGVGATLANYVPTSEMQTIPAPSAFSLAASRLGWALPDVETVSLHGKAISLIRPLLHPGTRILALTSDSNAPGKIANYLTELGFGPSLLTVLEALGGPDEQLQTMRAHAVKSEKFNPLNVLAVEVASEAANELTPLSPGLAESLFEHDGQITKREIRAVTISSLAPLRGELLWDIGAGSGSIAIEWMLRHPSMRAIAIEAAEERADRIRLNADTLGVPGLVVVKGTAPEALAGLQPPDAIFVGGGGSETGVMDAALDALKPGGRLVANAVTLEMEAMLIAKQATLGGELIRIAVSRSAPVGTMTGWRPAMPVTQWIWRKP